MKTKPNIRTTISDAQLHSWFFGMFESEKSGKTDLLGLLRTKYKIGRDRYFKSYDIAYLEWQEARKQADNEQLVENARETLKLNLMSKNERLEYLNKIAIGEIKVKRPFVVGGKIMEYPAEMSAGDRIKAIEVINKMLGDNEPTKLAVSGLKVGIEAEDEII
jgi:hypothetical protein